MEEFSTYTLSNGIRCIHRQAKGSVAHCALVVGAGTRDEAAGEFGLAHFTEHGLFKGTAKRKAWQVNCRLENLGGELNAFTTKEDTTLHATVLRSDFTKAVELLGDVLFCSTFPDRELEREKEVIYDEINTYKDAPAELIYDTFEDLIFASSELGHNILGRKANIARFTSETVQRFVARCYTTDQISFRRLATSRSRWLVLPPSVTWVTILPPLVNTAAKRAFVRPLSTKPSTAIPTKHTASSAVRPTTSRTRNAWLLRC